MTEDDDVDPCADGAHCCCCGPGEACCDCGKIMPAERTTTEGLEKDT